MFDNAPPPEPPPSKLRNVSGLLAAVGLMLFLVSLHLGVLAVTAAAATLVIIGGAGLLRTQSKDEPGSRRAQ